MKHIISDKRFREISDETRIENLTQEVGGAIVNHLNRLYEVYSNYCNIVLEFVEENNDKRRLHNPREWADGLVPRLMDDISRRNWGTESG